MVVVVLAWVLVPEARIMLGGVGGVVVVVVLVLLLFVVVVVVVASSLLFSFLLAFLIFLLRSVFFSLGLGIGVATPPRPKH